MAAAARTTKMQHIGRVLGGLIAAVLFVSPALAASDQQFISDAIKGDNSEIMLGKLAVQKASSTGVKRFGQTLVTDHSKAKTQAGAVAKRLGITPPDGPMDQAQAEYNKLSAMSGTAFDNEFVNYMVQDHQKDIGEFEDQAKSGDRTTAALAKRQLPTLEKHLKMATSLVGKV
jgi:putative membrane protein